MKEGKALVCVGSFGLFICQVLSIITLKDKLNEVIRNSQNRYDQIFANTVFYFVVFISVLSDFLILLCVAFLIFKDRPKLNKAGAIISIVIGVFSLIGAFTAFRSEQQILSIVLYLMIAVYFLFGGIIIIKKLKVDNQVEFLDPILDQ
ncbi:hypothetical protein SHELI_v1c06240 [Spiroplasma helicoides]|uniref:Uncharacterized protein n=1 Tax=Spiroplasma helicoides TaxID=216938 RepID=A0A1B3SKX6_9MOLU|nr:hypothetical protein [Spiroplasma helicoides]AOG60575.1 hypothetical protein SHELI_v1c06240 [Spiroplasma helicoides]